MAPLRTHPSWSWMILLTGASLLAASSLQARPQNDSNQSVAEAARKAKEQKKKSDKPVKTITDDDLAAQRAAAIARGEVPPEPGAPPPDQAGQPETKPKEGAPSDATKAEEAAKQDAELKRLKEELAVAERDLDLLKRDFALKSDQFYSKPDFSRDTAGKANLDAMQKQIADRQSEVDLLKTRIAALQELIARSKPAGEKDKAPGEANAPPPGEPAKPAPPSGESLR